MLNSIWPKGEVSEFWKKKKKKKKKHSSIVHSKGSQLGSFLSIDCSVLLH